jgi:hypothetical protein
MNIGSVVMWHVKSREACGSCALHGLRLDRLIKGKRSEGINWSLFSIRVDMWAIQICTILSIMMLEYKKNLHRANKFSYVDKYNILICLKYVNFLHKFKII